MQQLMKDSTFIADSVGLLSIFEYIILIGNKNRLIVDFLVN